MNANVTTESVLTALLATYAPELASGIPLTFAYQPAVSAVIYDAVERATLDI